VAEGRPARALAHRQGQRLHQALGVVARLRQQPGDDGAAGQVLAPPLRQQRGLAVAGRRHHDTDRRCVVAGAGLQLRPHQQMRRHARRRDLQQQVVDGVGGVRCHGETAMLSAVRPAVLGARPRSRIGASARMSDPVIPTSVLPPKLTDQRRWITPEPLSVAPALVGVPLATPTRRALAMAVDLVVVALLSGVGGFWLAGGLVLVLLQLRGRHRGAPGWRIAVGWGIAALLALLAFQEAADHWRQRHTANEPAASAPAEADDHAGAAVLKHAAGLGDAQRIAVLEAALTEARKPKPLNLQDELDRLVDAAGASFGWGIVYFSLLPAWWAGQTLGKKLFRLQVVELSGRPMTVMRCLKRYGGYAAGMATGGLGFGEMLWDVNRQAIQDRAAHTAVVDLRAAARQPAKIEEPA
jgi:hypothetical protein